MSNLLQKLQNKLLGDTTISNTSINTQINSTKKITTDNDSYTDYSSRFTELPDIYRHLPKEFKNAMIALRELHNTPYEFALSALLGYTNSCCHHLYNVDSYKYGIRPISMFMMIILGTGGSKSTIDGECNSPLREFERHMQDALKNEAARYQADCKRYKKQCQQWEQDRDSGIHAPFPAKPRPAETANYINSKFTVNGIIDTLMSQPHASVISAEAGEFFSSHAFQGGKTDTNRSTEMTSTLTKCWDGDQISRVIKEERVVLRNRRLNAMLMVQEGVIRPILNNVTFQEQGFTHRILISQIHAFDKPDMLFDSETERREQIARSALTPFLERLTELLHIRPTMIPDRDFELSPITITSTDSAKKIMADLYNRHKHIGKPGNKLSSYEGFANRIHEHTIRIAATLAAFNNHEVVQIGDSEALAAVDIINMFIDHRSRLELGITDTRPELTQGAHVLETWFKQHGSEEFTKREISQRGPVGFRKISDAQKITILEELLSGEVIVAVEVKLANGRRATKYRLNVE